MLLFICSCNYGIEKDKYPEMPYFAMDINEDFSIEMLDYLITDKSFTEDYMFLEKHDKNEDLLIEIYDQETKKVNHTIRLERGKSQIDISGNIYNYNDRKKKVFKYSPPNFEKQELKSLGVVLDDKRDTKIKEKYMKDLECILNLDYYNRIYILRYAQKEIFVKSDVFYNLTRGIGVVSKEETIFDYPICEKASIQEKSKQSNRKASYLKEIENITFNRSFSTEGGRLGSVKNYKIFYYELKVNNQILNFKSLYRMTELLSKQDEVIIKGKNQKGLAVNYKIKSKK